MPKRPEIRYKFGRRLRQLRKQKGWTQEDLSEHADTAYKHIQRLEGKAPCIIPVLSSISPKMVSLLEFRFRYQTIY